MSKDSKLDLFRKSVVLPDGQSNVDEAALIEASELLIPPANSSRRTTRRGAVP